MYLHLAQHTPTLVYFLTCLADYFVHHQNFISHLRKNHKV